MIVRNVREMKKSAEFGSVKLSSGRRWRNSCEIFQCTSRVRGINGFSHIETGEPGWRKGTRGWIKVMLCTI